MAKKKVIYVETPFVLRWYQLDLADVLVLQSYIRNHWHFLPEEVRQPFLNLYNSLNSPKNPRNLKFL